MIMKVIVITADLQKKHYFGLYRKWRLYSADRKQTDIVCDK